MTSVEGVSVPDRGSPVSVQAVLDAVGSPIRREILWLVWDHEMSAGDIAIAVGLSPATVSSHLTSLRTSGLVTLRVDGNFRRYRTDRSAMQAVVPLLAAGDEARWRAADDLPERRLADASTDLWVTVSTELGRLEPADAFAAFVDGDRYSAWLGVPVAITDGRFSAVMEWGTHVRGHYEVVAPPDLIAMRWDFDDDAVPVPGRQLVGYLRFSPVGRGTRVEVHQNARDAEQASFLAAAWSMVLGRLREHADQLPGARRGPRARRSKRR